MINYKAKNNNNSRTSENFKINSTDIKNNGSLEKTQNYNNNTSAKDSENTQFFHINKNNDTNAFKNLQINNEVYKDDKKIKNTDTIEKKENIDINNNVLDLNDNPNEKMNENEIDNEENDINTNDIMTITHINERNEDKINNYNYPKNKSNSKYL